MARRHPGIYPFGLHTINYHNCLLNKCFYLRTYVSSLLTYCMCVKVKCLSNNCRGRRRRSFFLFLHTHTHTLSSLPFLRCRVLHLPMHLCFILVIPTTRPAVTVLFFLLGSPVVFYIMQSWVRLGGCMPFPLVLCTFGGEVTRPRYCVRV